MNPTTTPPQNRDSRFSRLGTETPRLSVQDSSRSRNRNRNFKDFRPGIGIGIELFSILEPEPVSESDFEGCGTGIGTGIEILAPDLIHTILAVFTLKKCTKKCFFVIEMVLSTGIGLEIRDSQFRTWNQSRNRNRVLGMFGLGTGIGIEF